MEKILKEFEIVLKNEENENSCKFKINNGILNITLYNNKIDYEGNLTLNTIQNQIGAFYDFNNIYEIFEEINKLKINDFTLQKENENKFKLKLKFLIFRRIKYLHIDLYDKNKEQYIKCITELNKKIKEKDEIIKEKNEKMKEKDEKIKVTLMK